MARQKLFICGNLGSSREQRMKSKLTMLFAFCFLDTDELIRRIKLEDAIKQVTRLASKLEISSLGTPPVIPS
jgi:hypothetical protein